MAMLKDLPPTPMEEPMEDSSNKEKKKMLNEKGATGCV